MINDRQNNAYNCNVLFNSFVKIYVENTLMINTYNF